jgi:hypothetical protein
VHPGHRAVLHPAGHRPVLHAVHHARTRAHAAGMGERNGKRQSGAQRSKGRGNGLS